MTEKERVLFLNWITVADVHNRTPMFRMTLFQEHYVVDIQKYLVVPPGVTHILMKLLSHTRLPSPAIPGWPSSCRKTV